MRLWEYKMEKLTIRKLGRINETLDAQGNDGWELASIGDVFIFWKRPLKKPIRFWEHYVEAISVSTAGRIQKKLDKLAEDGWELCNTSRDFLYFKREIGPSAAATRDTAAKTKGRRRLKPEDRLIA